MPKNQLVKRLGKRSRTLFVEKHHVYREPQKLPKISSSSSSGSALAHFCRANQSSPRAAKVAKNQLVKRLGKRSRTFLSRGTAFTENRKSCPKSARQAAWEALLHIFVEKYRVPREPQKLPKISSPSGLGSALTHFCREVPRSPRAAKVAKNQLAKQLGRRSRTFLSRSTTFHENQKLPKISSSSALAHFCREVPRLPRTEKVAQNQLGKRHGRRSRTLLSRSTAFNESRKSCPKSARQAAREALSNTFCREAPRLPRAAKVAQNQLVKRLGKRSRTFLSRGTAFTENRKSCPKSARQAAWEALLHIFVEKYRVPREPQKLPKISVSRGFPSAFARFPRGEFGARLW